MSLLKFLSGSSGSGKGAQVQAVGPRGPMPTYMEQVKDKLRKHPECHECSEDDLDQLAVRLTEPKEILKYFSCSGDTSDSSEHESLQQPLLEGRREHKACQHELSVADLPVKLILSKRNIHDSRYATQITKMFEKVYGPLHVFLLVRDQIVEWDTTSLVVPHGKPIRESITTTTMDEHTALSQHLPKELNSEEVDLVFKAKAQKAVKIEELTKIIAHYNKYWYHHPLKRNCQTFACEAVVAMGYEKPPQLKSRFIEYQVKLKTKKKRNIPDFFDTHEAVDTFVLERRVELSPQDKEYIVFHYFQFHIVGKTESKDPDSWQCGIQNCQCELLERQLDAQSLILNHFRQEAVP